MDRKPQVLSLIFAVILSNHIFGQGDGSNLKSIASLKNHKYGYIDESNNVVIPYQFQNAYEFYKGKAIVKKNDKWGIIDTRGKTLYPFNYTNIKLLKEQELYVISTGKANGTGAVDLNFKTVIPFEFSYINPAGSVCIVVRITERFEYETGAYTKTGQKILDPVIKGELSETIEGYITNKKSGEAGLLKTTGEIIIPFEHRMVEPNLKYNYICVSDSLFNFYIYNLSGRKISDVAYDLFRPTREGYFTVKINGKWGIIKEDGVTIPCIYDEPDTSFLSGGAFILSKGGKYGVLDTTGREVIPFTWDKLIPYWQDLYLVRSNRKEGILNSEGKVIVPCTFDKIPGQPSKGLFILQDSRNRYGSIDVSGRQVVPFVLDEEYVKTNFKTASADLAKLLEADPLNPVLVYLDALGWYSSLKPADALPLLTKHVDKFRNNNLAPGSLLYLRAKAYTDLNNFQAAENDAMWANGFSEWGSKAYIYMGDKKFREKDFKAAEHYYLYAGLYFNKEEANQYRSKAIAELKKLGQWVEEKKYTLKPELPIANLPVTILNFTTTDKVGYKDWEFIRLFTYDEAVTDCPNGYRLPAVSDWVNLIDYIMRQKDISPSRAYSVKDYIGTGWKTEFYVKKVMKTEHYVYNSADEFGLNITPLRSHNNVRGISDYELSHDVIQYWCVPGEINGKKANIIEFSSSGFRWLYAEDNKSTACVRYIKKK